MSPPPVPLTAAHTTTDSVDFDLATWVRLLVLCTAILLEGMSLSSVSIQLSAIQRELGLRADELQLVASSFLTTYAGFLLTGGKLADRLGARGCFLAGISLFGCASVGSALGQNALELVAARCFQGIAAAITTPAAMAMIASTFPAGVRRNRALGVLSAAGAGGFCFGVLAGGLLTDRLGWRWAFGLYIPLSLVTLTAAIFALRSSTRSVRERVPWPSAVLVTLSLIALVYSVGRLGSPPYLAMGLVFGAGLLGLLAFGVLQAKSSAPLLPPALLSHPQLASACVGLGVGFAGIMGGMFLLATFVQGRLGYSALEAGLAFLPQGAAVGVGSIFASKLCDRYSAQRVAFGGLVLIVLGLLLYLTVEGQSYITGFLPATLLVGFGISTLYPAATALGVGAARPEEQGIASGVITTCQQAGGALGIAISTGIGDMLEARLHLDSAGLWTCVALGFIALFWFRGLQARHRT